MRYGAIMSRCGTRREIGRMSAAGDQGEAQNVWQEVEKQDKTSVAARGANRRARRGHKRDVTNVPDGFVRDTSGYSGLVNLSGTGNPHGFGTLTREGTGAGCTARPKRTQ